MNKETRKRCQRIWHMCRGAARAIYGANPPSDGYAYAAAQLLYMTAAHESDGFRARRQYGFDPAPISFEGAFSLWQMERGSISTTIGWLGRRPRVAQNAQKWLGYLPCHRGVEIPAMRLEAVCTGVQGQEGDALACVFARCHYMWITPKPIPRRAEDLAAYAKQYWNTEAGSATAMLYMNAFDAYWLEEFETWPH